VWRRWAGSALCVLIGALPEPGVSTPAPLSVAVLGATLPQNHNNSAGCKNVCVGACVRACVGVCVCVHVLAGSCQLTTNVSLVTDKVDNA